MVDKALYTLSQVNFDQGGGSSNDIAIGQITDFSADPSTQEKIFRYDGSPYAQANHVESVTPFVEFTTTAIALALAKIGLTGATISALTTELGLSFWFRQKVQGLADPAATALQGNIKAGSIVPMKLTCDNSGARLTYRAMADYDGTNAPIVWTAAQSITGTPGTMAHFRVGPVKHKTTVYDGVKSWELDFGVQFKSSEGREGSIYPNFSCLWSIEPKITVNLANPALLPTVSFAGQAIDTSFTLFMRKNDASGIPITDATAENISIIVTQGRIKCKPISASSDNPAELSLEITPEKPAGLILTVNTTTAIS